ncbi:hypothetical protein PGUG_03384 [Meyerozyma guilliermondii ATCC 6260]|uniref:Endoplasmic reticulum-Golgi intermediate compartment protein n=1 Tax=Meyerozyma guilliermondii (strain ATCC 6260 / CBS 566 / DSM 6381 / JCM 1539 / NBRC 10279 / NRRL Y-324) TaxID=294746 RepID=A5DJD3_PICGU|nr:uncharacterized protein PGUG_03384 [Meyerozyma guilliermondii ATCC 6260]EDK39286.2 hypothetical protein PGUG_03384 [Meyerozyma guilliermondii ATCC 6260]
MPQPKLLSFDAFAKTVEDARVRTPAGGIITLICVIVVLYLIRNEYSEYTSIINRPELVVDRDINKKLEINLDISFPDIPCDVLTMDILDVSGDLQVDLLSSGFEKFRLLKDGSEIRDESPVMSSAGELEERARGRAPDGSCGSCYGALPQDENSDYCCNDCETVRLAYAQKAWGFFDGENIEQCEREGYVARLNEKINNFEGCRIKGTGKINRISGNLHFAPGASFTAPGSHFHDLSLFNKYDDKFTFDHVINHLSFGSDPHNIQFFEKQSTHPLDKSSMILKSKDRLYSYYLKVVATRFEFLTPNTPALETNQFSVISHHRPLAGGKDDDHQHTLHARGGLPGVFFHFEISPMKIINKEQYAKTWSGFVLGVISSIAGVLMVGALLDRSVWAAERVIRAKKDE